MTYQTITQKNAEKVIERLEAAGRQVDRYRAMTIFSNMFENKSIKADYVGDVCDQYACILWNYGLVS